MNTHMNGICTLAAMLLFSSGVRAQYIPETIKTENGHYLTAVNGGGQVGPGAPIDTNRTSASTWESFSAIPLQGLPNTYALQTFNGNYVTALLGGGQGGSNDGSSPIHTDAATAAAWEQFFLVPVPGARFEIKPANERYFLTAQNGGGLGGSFPVHTDATSIGPWEEFTLSNPLPPLLSFPYIEVITYTGGDDLRSGSQAIAALTQIGQNLTYTVQTLSQSLNGGSSYGNDTTHTVILALPHPILGYSPSDVTNSINALRISLVQGSGFSPDNWDLEGLQVKLLQTNSERTSPHIFCLLNVGYFGPGDHGDQPAIARLQGAPNQTSVLLAAPDVTSSPPGCATR